ncbi:MAG TPA: alpha/beta fold hydrolase [Thermoanaerobaculia bacterium]|nr:alpha/beta fold hydrolase [Thermoanaerobaculia bacterium]
MRFVGSVLLLLAFPAGTHCAGAPRPEVAPPPLEREVSFTSRDGTRLAGTLFLPSSSGPHPAAVFIHGSGPSDRRNAVGDGIARGLASRGIAVLYPDKRGSGESGGDWKEVGFEPLAEDAAAGAALLRDKAGIEAEAVGVIGFSQGAHIAPLAARRAGAAFAIALSGSLVSMGEQIFDEVELMGERAGLGPEEIETINHIHRLAFHYGRTGEGWDEYAAARAAASEREWAGREIAAGFPSSRDHFVWSWAPRILDYDPILHWKRLRIPGLVVWGENDTQVRVGESAAIAAREIPGFEVTIYPGAGHGLFREGTHLVRDDLLDDLAAWICRQRRSTLRSD